MIQSRREEFFAGIRTELPILIGVIPFGMIYGALALQSGLRPGQAQAMSAIIFAGSAQLLITQLFHLGSPGLLVILSIGVINLRHLLYSASIAPYLKDLNSLWKWLLSYLLTDEAYAVTIIHYREGDTPTLENPLHNSAYSHWYFLGAGLALWLSWQISTAIGISLGTVIPSTWSLDFALVVTFIALLIPNVKDGPGLLVVLTSGLIATITFGWPYKLGLLVAVLIGILVGILVDRSRERNLTLPQDKGSLE